MKKTIQKSFCCFLAVLLFCMCTVAGTLPAITAKADRASNEQTIYEYCSQVLGFNNAACAGILANIQRESWFDPTAVGDAGAAYGICQWNSRRQDLITFCNQNGYSYSSMEGQLAFLKYELTQVSWFSEIYNILKTTENSATGAYWAAYYFSSKYEIPVSSEHTIRAELARDTYWPKYGKVKNPQIITPADGAQIDASKPGNLSWNAVSDAKAYRYTIQRVDSSGNVLKTVASNILVSSSTTSVSLLKSSNSSLTEALMGASTYKVTVIAYSDTSGSTALGSGSTVRFTTKSSKLCVPSLTSPAALTPTAYTSHYAAVSSKKVDPYANLSLVWTATGDYYKVDLAVLSESPNPSKATEKGTTVISGKVTTTNALTVSASTLMQYAGKYIRVKIVAYSNTAGIYESYPVYYYFERTQEIKGYTVTFKADSGKVDTPSVFVLDSQSVIMPTATAYASDLIYDGSGGRCIPADQSFFPNNIGWTTNANSNKVMYTTGSSQTFAGDTTLYAVWSSKVRVSSETPVRSGYDFAGWLMQAGDDSEIIKPGATIERQDCENILLTAVWSKNYGPTITSVVFHTVPEKKFYKVGETIDLRGLVVKATYSDGSTVLISEGLVLTTDSVASTGARNITIDCEGHKLSLTVYVLEDTSNLVFDVGDVDMDRVITAADARIAIRSAVGLCKLNSAETALADPDGDGKVTAADARKILRASVQLEDTSSWKRYSLS